MYTHQQCDLLKEMYYAESESTDDSQQVASHMHQSINVLFQGKTTVGVSSSFDGQVLSVQLYNLICYHKMWVTMTNQYMTIQSCFQFLNIILLWTVQFDWDHEGYSSITTCQLIQYIDNI